MLFRGTAVKVVIWCLTAIGLTPALLLALGAAVTVVAVAAADRARPPAPGAVRVLRGNFQLQIGPVRLEDWHPHAWAAVALVVGAALVVIALIFLLHVPGPS